jgi:CP family cyanate transporter-like MFS transporter
VSARPPAGAEETAANTRDETPGPGPGISSGPGPAKPVHTPLLLGAGMILLAINLRPAAASVGPLIHRIRHDTGLSGTGAGVLTTLPVLCFGALAPLAPALARRLGSQVALTGALVLLLLGLLIRVVPGFVLLYAGTALAGTAIAVGNVLLPVMVSRSFPERTGSMTGLYAAALIGFAALAAGLTVPLMKWLGGGWRTGLVIWAAPVAVALVVWLIALRGRRGETIGADPHEQLRGARTLMRSRLAWAVTLFFGIQSASFYATLAWLPSIFESHGASDAKAGLLLSLTLIVGVFTALTVPPAAARMRQQRALVVIFTACIAAGWIGILAAPMSAPYLWAVLLGIGQNACFPLALTLIVLRAGGVATTSALSTLVQSVGYGLAALAPLAIGALHDLTNSWNAPLIVLLALVAPQALVGFAAGADRTVTAGGE